MDDHVLTHLSKITFSKQSENSLENKVFVDN